SPTPTRDIKNVKKDILQGFSGLRIRDLQHIIIYLYFICLGQIAIETANQQFKTGQLDSTSAENSTCFQFWL
ncbi:MAG: hypothetical protein ACKO5E_18685, partial [bacterium]